MTTRDIIYNEAKSPLMSDQENLEFRKLQLYIYRTIFSLMQQGFSYENFIAKLRTFVGMVNSRCQGYYICAIMESVDSIFIEFYPSNHLTARAQYILKYE